MRNGVAITILLVVLHASAAHAQDQPSPTAGWATAGVHAGLAVGAAATYGLYQLLHDDDPNNAAKPGTPGAPLAFFFGVVALDVGLPTGGGFGAAALAERGGWSRTSGWGATGAMLGGISGGALGYGALHSFADKPSDRAQWMAVTGGAIAGGLVDYALLAHYAGNDASMVGEVLGAYGGALVGWWSGLLVSGVRYGKDGIKSHLDVPIATAGLGSFVGIVAGHYLQPQRSLGSTAVRTHLTPTVQPGTMMVSFSGAF